MLKEKLRVELLLLKQTPLGSLSTVLNSINQLLWPEESTGKITQTLQYHSTQLKISAQSLTESERLEKLNEYFFKTLDFQVVADSTAVHEWLLAPVLENKKGHPIIVSLVYLIFADNLQLPINLLNHKSFSLLKWSRPKESSIVDLTLSGACLTTKQIIERFKSQQFISDELESLSHSQSVTAYIHELLGHLDNEENSLKKLSLLDALLNIDPSNLCYLGQRALLFKTLNQRKPALEDLKRYFSYVDQASAPDNIQNAYYELCLEPSPHNLVH